MPRKDKVSTPSVTATLQSLGYNLADWDDSQTNLPSNIKEVFKYSSKSKNGNSGWPDRIFFDKNNKLLILVEEKPNILDHEKEDVKKGAISGIKWYLSQFFSDNLDKIKTNLKNKFLGYKILGIAVSGNLLKEYESKFNCYMVNIESNTIDEVSQITNFVTEKEFLAVFENFDEEKMIRKISSSSDKINSLLRCIDSQKRPILLSALMICLHKKPGRINTFIDIYQNYQPNELADNILPVAINILKEEKIPLEKIEVLSSELAFLSNDKDLRSKNILVNILNELQKNVIPLFNGNFSSNSNYDIIGRFYSEFLKYAGVSNVKKGIVLTPQHITTLFCELVDLKENDKILDLCCGTGAFLIAGMNALINSIQSSDRKDKVKAISEVKTKQLLGFDSNPTMFICAISNMLFRGDGKSHIYNLDSTSEEALKIIKKFKPTIGFINPPYSGQESDKDPTPKELTFLEIMLDNCSRYGVIIAPLSMFFSASERREEILKKHTLKAVITMPKDLFQPNASTHTCIGIFETHRSFIEGKDEVVFYDLRDDGFVLTKSNGRTDIYNKWNPIKNNLIKKIKNCPEKTDEITLLKKAIKRKDEWTIYAHSKTDYSSLNTKDFINSINNYLLYESKKDLGILADDLTDAQLLDIMIPYYQKLKTKNKISSIDIDISNWQLFKITEIFEIKDSKGNKTYDLSEGTDIPYVAAKKTNNGIKQMVSKSNMEDYISDGNCIVFIHMGDGSGGYSLYEPDEFIGMKNKTSSGYNENLNKYSGLFIITMLDKAEYKFEHGRNWNSDRFSNTTVLLPEKDGKPDWQFMEKFIKSLPNGDLI